MAWYNPATLRYEQGEPIDSNRAPSATDAFAFTRPGMTTGMGLPGSWGSNPVYGPQSPNFQTDLPTPPANNGSWESAATWRPNFVNAPQAPDQNPSPPPGAPPQFAPTSAQVAANPSQYAGTSWGAALLPDSPGNIAAQRIAFFNQPGQQSDFSAQGSQPAGWDHPGQVFDPQFNVWRSPNDPPPGAVRTNNPNIWLLPNGSTWNPPGYSNNVRNDQQFDQFRQQWSGTGITGPATGAGMYGNTQGAGAGPTNLAGPGIPYSPNASPAQQAVMATRPVQVAPPPQFVDQGPQQVSGIYQGNNYPLTPGMPGYVSPNATANIGTAPGPLGQNQWPPELLSLLASIFGNGSTPNNLSYGANNQAFSSQNNPYGFVGNTTSAWDNFNAQGGNAGGGRSSAANPYDNAASLNPGQMNTNQQNATSGANNGSLSSQFSTPESDSNPWSGINQLPSASRSGNLWG